MKAKVIVALLSMFILSAASFADQPAERAQMSVTSRSSSAILSGSKTDVSQLMSFAGTLIDTNGIALDTTVSMAFSIYADSVGGTAVWTETQSDVEVAAGVFNVLLGRVTPIGDDIFSDPVRWFGLKVGTDLEMEPRQRIGSVAYAFWAAEADTAEYARNSLAAGDGWRDDGSVIRLESSTDSVGIGTAAPTVKLEIDGDVKVDSTLFVSSISSLSPLILEAPEGVPRVFIGDISGKVGIGVMSPSAKLDVSGAINTNSVYKIAGDTVLSTEGTENLFVGPGAGSALSGGINNTFVGSSAGPVNTTGSINTFVGQASGYHNTTGPYNVFLGASTGWANTTGTENTFVGAAAGFDNTTGSGNTFIGRSAGSDNSEGAQNTFVGFRSGGKNSSDGNTFLGYRSGYNNSSGDGNTFLGLEAGYSNTNGDDNTLVGANAGFSGISIRCNTIVGSKAGYVTEGDYNTFLGCYAGEYNGSGRHNTFIGSFAGQNNTDGSGNIFIGHMAGRDVYGSNVLYIANTDSTNPLIWGNLYLNKVVINGDSLDNPNNRRFFVNGSAGGTTAWYNDSDERLKKEITTIPEALQKVCQLRGVTFEWKEPECHEPGRQMGFIAQEAVDVIPEVVIGEDGHYAMSYGPITALLVEAIKEQQKEIDELKAELARRR